MQTFWSSEPRHWLALFRSLDSTEANEIPANNWNHSLKLKPSKRTELCYRHFCAKAT